MPNFEFENNFSGTIAGIDEVGLGPLAGPIVVAGCIIKNRKSKFLQNIDDSKKLSVKKREIIYNNIINYNDFIFSHAIISNSIIDSIGLSNAWKMGIIQVINNLMPDVCLIDGRKNVEIVNIVTQSIIKGDQKSYSIAAASIIAKVIRDNIMYNLHKKYPQYGFNTNVGYGTAKHIAAIKKYGITEYHRVSFAKVKN